MSNNYIYNAPRLLKRRRSLRRNQTPAEGLLWMYLRNKQLEGLKFFRQYSIGNYIADFYCPRLRLVVEVDGSQHGHYHRELYDKERTEYFEEIGIQVLRFWNAEVLEGIDGVLIKILETAHIPIPK